MDSKDANLAEQGYLEFGRCLSRLSGGRQWKAGNFSVFVTPENTWYTRVCDLSPDPGGENALVRHLITGARDGSLPNTVVCTREVVGEVLERELRNAGYEPWKEQTGMLLDLPSFSCAARHPQVGAVSTEELAEWIKTMMVSFGKQDGADAMRALYQAGTGRFYAARENGRIVGTILLWVDGPYAGLHELGVLPGCRGSHLATGLMRAALADARELGCTVGVLQASQMGRPIYERLGWRAVSTILHWKLNER